MQEKFTPQPIDSRVGLAFTRFKIRQTVRPNLQESDFFIQDLLLIQEHIPTLTALMEKEKSNLSVDQFLAR